MNKKIENYLKIIYNKDKTIIEKFGAVSNLFSIYYHKKLELKKTKNCKIFKEYKNYLKSYENLFNICSNIINEAEFLRLENNSLFYNLEGIDLLKRTKAYFTYTKLFFFTKNNRIKC